MELMVVLSIIAAIIGLGTPAMLGFMENSRLSGTANDLLRSLNVARVEAIKRQMTMVGTADTLVGVALCGTTDADDAALNSLSCADSTTGGWFVYTDNNGNSSFDSGSGEVVVERHAAPPAGVSILVDGSSSITYNAAGFAYPDPNGGGRNWINNVVICDRRGTELDGTRSTARALLVSRTGRARVTRDPTEVEDALTATGASCPT